MVQDSISASKYCSLDQLANYYYGTCLQTLTSINDIKPNDFFRLPQSSLSHSSCIYDKPVRFLVNIERTFCDLQINQVKYFKIVLS